MHRTHLLILLLGAANCTNLDVVSNEGSSVDPKLFLEYVGRLYTVAEDWWGLEQIYTRLNEEDGVAAEELLGSVKDMEVQGKIRKRDVGAHEKIGWVRRYIWGQKDEWPEVGSALANAADMARTLLEAQEWNALEGIILDKIITDKHYESSQIPKRMVVAGGLALLDFKPDVPNCLPPWDAELDGATLHIGQKAKILYTVLSLRARKIDLNGVGLGDVCKHIDIHSAHFCARALIAGGYEGADELIKHARNGTEKRDFERCYSLIWGKEDKLAEADRGLQKIVGAMNEWRKGMFELQQRCPNKKNYYLRLPFSLHSSRKVRNLERLFWTLLSAQLVAEAEEVLAMLTAELKGGGDKEQQKELRMMGKILRHTTPITEPILDPDQISAIYKPLLEGDLKGAEKVRKQLIKDVQDQSSIELRYVNHLISLFRNPHLLGVQGPLRRDWTEEWMFVRAVDQFGSEQKLVEMPVKGFYDEKEMLLFKAHVYFYTGRYGDLLRLIEHEMSKTVGKDGELARAADIENNATLQWLSRTGSLCSERREELCPFVAATKTLLPEGEHEIISAPLCNSMQMMLKVDILQLFPPRPFRLSADGENMINRLAADGLLFPLLPSEAPVIPLAIIDEVFVLKALSRQRAPEGEGAVGRRRGKRGKKRWTSQRKRRGRRGDDLGGETESSESESEEERTFGARKPRRSKRDRDRMDQEGSESSGAEVSESSSSSEGEEREEREKRERTLGKRRGRKAARRKHEGEGGRFNGARKIRKPKGRGLAEEESGGSSDEYEMGSSEEESEEEATEEEEGEKEGARGRKRYKRRICRTWTRREQENLLDDALFGRKGKARLRVSGADILQRISGKLNERLEQELNDCERKKLWLAMQELDAISRESCDERRLQEMARKLGLGM